MHGFLLFLRENTNFSDVLSPFFLGIIICGSFALFVFSAMVIKRATHRKIINQGALSPFEPWIPAFFSFPAGSMLLTVWQGLDWYVVWGLLPVLIYAAFTNIMRVWRRRSPNYQGSFGQFLSALFDPSPSQSYAQTNSSMVSKITGLDLTHKTVDWRKASSALLSLLFVIASIVNVFAGPYHLNWFFPAAAIGAVVILGMVTREWIAKKPPAARWNWHRIFLAHMMVFFAAITTLSIPLWLTASLFVIALIILAMAAPAASELKMPTSHGSARFTEADDLDPEYVFPLGSKRPEDELGRFFVDPVDHGLPIGWGLLDQPGKLGPNCIIRYSGDMHLVTLGATRSGKGIGAVFPAMMAHRGSAIVIDPKGECAQNTAKYRQQVKTQTCYFLDPFDEAQQDQTHSYNPLDSIQFDSPMAVDQANRIAELLAGSDEAAGDSFWSDSAEELVAGLVLHVATSPMEAGNRNLGRVRDILTQTPDDFMATIEEMQRPENHRAVIRAANSILGDQKSERTAASIQRHAKTETRWLDSDAMRETTNTTSPGLDLNRLKSDDPITVYVCLPQTHMHRNKRWLKLVVGTIIDAVSRDKRRSTSPVLFLLDEAHTIGRLKDVETGYGLLAGYGIKLWTIWQDISQMRQTYGNMAETFMSNSGVVQFMGGQDMATAKYLSEWLGKSTIKSPDYNLNPEDNTQVRYMGRDLVTPDEIITEYSNGIGLLKLYGVGGAVNVINMRAFDGNVPADGFLNATLTQIPDYFQEQRELEAS